MTVPATSLSESARAWLAFTQRLGEAGLQVHSLADDARTPEQQAEINQTLLWLLSAGSLYHAHIDPDHPDWMPSLNHIFLQAASSADNIYQFTRIRGSGSYRITGSRGTAARIDLQLSDGMVGFPNQGETLGNFDFADFEMNADGTFAIIASPARPEGYTGNWIPLRPEIDDTFLMCRQIFYEWRVETPPVITIQRIDQPIHRASGRHDINRRLERVSTYVRDMATWLHQTLEQQRFDTAVPNLIDDYTRKFSGGALLKGQGYYGGKIQVGDDEALIIDVDIPQECPYWNAQLMDSFFSSLDYTYRHASLNKFDTTRDPDGIIRIVISGEDVGAPNWLDKGDYEQVAIRMRWFKTTTPQLSTKKVRLSEIRGHLYPGTQWISMEDRQDIIRKRVEAVQSRRRW
jgi:hypothetical protein